MIRLLNYSRVNEKSLERIRHSFIVEYLFDRESDSKYNLIISRVMDLSGYVYDCFHKKSGIYSILKFQNEKKFRYSEK
ncbi:hypothetical protein DPV73_05965 [Leptospira mayottensis]|nr:hypothetical protein DPV73_05965 [Leptospira mayottensis]